MEARGMYDFNATAEDELNFKKDDILKIIGSQDEWYKAELHGQEGFIPQNYVDMQTPSWYQEDASRGAAEELLMNKEVGCFVIRGCQSSPGDFSISVKHDCDVQHFKVMKDSKGHYFLWSERFTSLNKLVEFYKSTSISKLREIYLIDGGNDSMKCSSTLQTLKRGSLPEQRNYVNTPSATTATQRRASDQPHNQLSKRAGLEERAHTIGHTGRSSPVSTSASVSRRTSETMPNPQRAATSIKAKAIYDFIAEEDDELGFGFGDIIEVLDRSDATWWKGRLRGKSGLFPANYTSPL